MNCSCECCGESVSILIKSIKELESEDAPQILCFACKKQPRTRRREKIGKMKAFDDDR